CRLHQLRDRAQRGGERVHRRRGALPHLFGAWLERDRRREALLRRRPHLLARQCGNAAVLSLGMAYVPDAASAIDQLPPWLNRSLAIGTLGALVVYVTWVWRTPRIIRRQNWEIALPNGPLTLLQIAVGILDLSCCAAAMYMLVPNEPHIGFFVLAMIFV